MIDIFIIAANTYRQTIRDRILYGIVIFALLFLGSTIVIGSLSLGEDLFVIKSFGLAGIYLFGLIITIFLGSSIVYDEVEKKITYLLLSKPIRRSDIIVGKFLGLLASIGLTVLFMALAYMGIVFIKGAGINYDILSAIFLQFLEFGIIISLLIFFSIITTPLAATIYTVVLIYIGHLLSLLSAFAIKSTGIVKLILLAAYYIMPNLEKFNVRNLIAHNIPIPSQEILISTGYAIFYIILVLHIAISAFNRKDL